MSLNPYKKIIYELSDIISDKDILFLPKKWEKIGDVAIISLNPKLKKYEKNIGKAYADILKCKTVLNDIGGIQGELRQPVVELIYGSKNTITIHKENEIRFKLDPQKIMFSSGNMDERIRMSNISNNSEVVIDMFAGIGYFSLPIAVFSKPKKIYAVEKNPVSFSFLKENIVLNDVTEIVEPMFGDCRKVAPKNIADRVILGYFKETIKFLPTAVECLKNKKGIIHYHDVFSDEKIPQHAINKIQKKVSCFKKDLKLLNYKIVKSYAPGIKHVVFDIKVR